MTTYADLIDSTGKYFRDNRRCCKCNNLIMITERYDYIIVGPENEKRYMCEICNGHYMEF